MGMREEYFHLLEDNPEKVAFDLYYQLRKADASNADVIVIELPLLQGHGKEYGSVSLKQALLTRLNPYSLIIVGVPINVPLHLGVLHTTQVLP